MSLFAADAFNLLLARYVVLSGRRTFNAVSSFEGIYFYFTFTKYFFDLTCWLSLIVDRFVEVAPLSVLALHLH